MTDLGDLKEQKFFVFKTGMSTSIHNWRVLMAASTRSRAKDVFEGLINQALVENSVATTNSDPPLLTPQKKLMN